MSTFFARLKVVLTALPTWLAAVTLALGVVSAELVPLLPGPAAAQVAGYISTALAFIAALVRVISKVTPVLPAAEGLLPNDDGVPATAGEARLAEQLRNERSLTP